MTLQRQTNFEHIEGLRGYLAVWVAVGHGLQLSGFLSLPKPFSILLQGDAAVAVFMTVSGFVIAHLLTVKQEAYRPYLIRRFFRLYPAYVLACFAGFLLLPLWSSIVTQAPWSSQSGWAEYRASVQTIEDQSYGNFLPHFLAHLTMLHGLIPNQILPKAPLTFLPAAWSISLEWQFYLLAPSILLALKSNFGRIAIFVMVALGSAAATRGYFGNFEVASFILLGSAYFSLGIASRLSFETLSDMRIEVATAATLSIVALAATAGLPLPVLVWLAFYFVLLWHKEMGMLGRLFNYLFASPAVLAVGRSSYSLYLLHRPFQVALGAIALFWLGANRQLMLSFELMAIVLTIPAALLFYEYVEKPGMALGKRLAGGLPLSNQRA